MRNQHRIAKGRAMARNARVPGRFGWAGHSGMPIPFCGMARAVHPVFCPSKSGYIAG